MNKTEQDWLDYFQSGGKWIWSEGETSRIIMRYIERTKEIIERFEKRKEK